MLRYKKIIRFGFEMNLHHFSLITLTGGWGTGKNIMQRTSPSGKNAGSWSWTERGARTEKPTPLCVSPQQKAPWSAFERAAEQPSEVREQEPEHAELPAVLESFVHNNVWLNSVFQCKAASQGLALSVAAGRAGCSPAVRGVSAGCAQSWLCSVHSPRVSSCALKSYVCPSRPW